MGVFEGVGVRVGVSDGPSVFVRVFEGIIVRVGVGVMVAVQVRLGVAVGGVSIVNSQALSKVHFVSPDCVNAMNDRNPS